MHRCAVEESLRTPNSAPRATAQPTAKNPPPLQNPKPRITFGTIGRVPTVTQVPAGAGGQVAAPVPMEIDRAAASEGRTRAFRCYRCSKEGHIGRNCPDNGPSVAQIRTMIQDALKDTAEKKEDFPEDRE